MKSKQLLLNARIFRLLVLFLFLQNILFGQQANYIGQSVIERIVESYAEELSEDGDLTLLLEDLEAYLETPMNINAASRTDLEKLFFLTSYQIENLLAYRKQYGQLYSQFELEAIEGFNAQLAADLAAFVAFLPPDVQVKTYWKQEMLLRYGQYLEPSAGFVANDDGEKAFAGSPARYLFKYRVEKGDRFKLGLTAENDAGEQFFAGNNPYGFDFYSGYLGFSAKKVLSSMIIGDYQVKTGQGLVMWSGYGKRKSSEGIGVRATGQGLRANTSADENNFMRGVAAHFELGSFDLLTYYSNNNVDATVVLADSAQRPLVVSSLQSSGYHRTNTEINNKNALNVQTAGANLKYTYKRFSLGLNGAWRLYGAQIDPAWQPYNHYYFRGDQNFNLSTDMLWVFNRINFFSEAAYSKSGGMALIAGFESQPANKIGISMVYRNYAPDFHTINGTAFGESDGVRNEHGIYAGLTLLPFSKVKISGYVDSYASHWVRYTSTGPVRGADFIFQTEYSPTRTIEMYIRLKSENNSEKSSVDEPVKPDVALQTTRARYNINWSVSEYISLRMRAEWSGYEKEGKIENGWLFFADVASKPFPKLTATARMAWFNTQSYNSRVYAYENDVPQYFYIPAFYSNGLRYYLNMSYTLLDNLKVYFKISQSLYLDDEFSIGSGNTAVDGNKRTEARVQLRYRF
ncbi:MAG TPA: helix-hairpin-helix domain-containing protein [Prolixibacteraceae bacterium]|nr:helix-hairpin-helix domain-containing protein [Prolixibacteraceae bacterium]